MSSEMGSSRMNSRLRYDLNRQRLRRECREILSGHIKQKTHLDIQPAKVRLTNTEKDGYCWLHKPEVAHIFSRCLSRQTLASYKEICSGVGVNFEAVAAPRVSDQIILERPEVTQCGSQLLEPKGGSEVEASNVPEAGDMSNELMYQLLLSAQQSLIAERADRERKECELKALQTEYERLAVKYKLTTDIMCKSLYSLDAIATAVGGLRGEISSSINTIVLDNPECYKCD